MRKFPPAAAALMATALVLTLSEGHARAADPAPELARGDELHGRGQIAEARAAYQAALAADPSSYAALCRLARVESEMGGDAKGEGRRQLVASAVQHARAAVTAAPASA